MDAHRREPARVLWSAAHGCSRWFTSVADSEPKKSAPLPWLLLTGLLGVFAVGVPATNGPSAPAKKEEKRDSDVQPVQVAADNPLTPVFDFHKTAKEHGTLNPADELSRNLHGYKTEFLIATVPDPIDSPYGHTFDQALDAIQRAIEKKDGYILDRAWLPWDLDRKAKPKAGDPPSTLHITKPGMMLFRHGRDKSKQIDAPGLCVNLSLWRDADERITAGLLRALKS